MTQTKNRHITCIGMSAICVDEQCHKICIWMVLKGEKASLNLMRNSYKNYDEGSGKGYIIEYSEATQCSVILTRSNED